MMQLKGKAWRSALDPLVTSRDVVVIYLPLIRVSTTGMIVNMWVLGLEFNPDTDMHEIMRREVVWPPAFAIFQSRFSLGNA